MLHCQYIYENCCFKKNNNNRNQWSCLGVINLPPNWLIFRRHLMHKKSGRLYLYLSLNIYLQDVEHAWKDRYWRSTFIESTESPRLIKERTGEGGGEGWEGLTWNSLSLVKEVKVNQNQVTASYRYLSCHTLGRKAEGN